MVPLLEYMDGEEMEIDLRYTFVRLGGKKQFEMAHLVLEISLRELQEKVAEHFGGFGSTYDGSIWDSIENERERKKLKKLDMVLRYLWEEKSLDTSEVVKAARALKELLL